MKARARDAGLSLVELIVVLSLLGTVSVLFLGVGAVSFSKQAETGNTLIDAAQRIALQSRLSGDLRESTAMGTEDAPCSPTQAAPVVWMQAGAADAVMGTQSGDVIVYAVANLTTRSGSPYTSLRRTQCTRDAEGRINPVAQEGDEMARWAQAAPVVVRCNNRAPGEGCGGWASLTGPMPAELNELATFPGIPTTAPAAPGTHADAPVDQLRIGTEVAVITGGWGATLSLSRPHPGEWAEGTVLSYAPSLVEVCVPLQGIECGQPDADALRITVNRRLP